VVPPSQTTLRTTRRYKFYLRAGKNWPKRLPRVPQGKPPGGTACVCMPLSSYKLVFRLILTEGLNLSTRAILGTWSGPTLKIRQLLPDDTQIQPLDELISVFHDVNGGRLPIVGSVYLGMTRWGQSSHVSFGL